MAQQLAFFGCFATLAVVMSITNFVIIPVPLQMMLYTFPIIYIGSHLSLKMKEVDADTGERLYQAETVTRKDAMLFPFIGSAALFSLYLVYKFLPPFWVNLLLTTYLTVVGMAAVCQTAVVCVERITPPSFNSPVFSYQFQLPGPLKNPDGPYNLKPNRNELLSSVFSVTVAVLWLWTKHWALHNVLAIAFSVQAIRLISVSTFSIATILLCGLFVYDIFWVFGTDVMVMVAKSFEGPAKIIFPTRFNPWAQSILGLGDVVIPGVLIAMTLRFDNWLVTAAAEKERENAAADTTIANGSSLSNTTDSSSGPVGVVVDIHERFSKRYFFCQMAVYEAGLLTTAMVMFAFNSPQPALLYLVPYCLLGLYVPAYYWGELEDVFGYSEEEEEETPQQQQQSGEDHSDVAEADLQESESMTQSAGKTETVRERLATTAEQQID